MADDVEELVRGPYWVVTYERARGFVRIRRTTVPFASLEDVVAQPLKARDALTGVERARVGVLLDLRDGPLRNDPAFEKALEDPRLTTLFTGFARNAVLVRTQVGKLQVMRRNRETGVQQAVFDDEAAAIACVSSGGGRGELGASGVLHAVPRRGVR